MDEALRWEVMKRAGLMCEHCQLAPAGELHHRKMRSQGGPDTEANLVALCSACHRQAHANPAWAYGEGLLVSGFSPDPDTPYTARQATEEPI